MLLISVPCPRFVVLMKIRLDFSSSFIVKLPDIHSSNQRNRDCFLGYLLTSIKKGWEAGSLSGVSKAVNCYFAGRKTLVISYLPKVSLRHSSYWYTRNSVKTALFCHLSHHAHWLASFVVSLLSTAVAPLPSHPPSPSSCARVAATKRTGIRVGGQCTGHKHANRRLAQHIPLSLFLSAWSLCARVWICSSRLPNLQ